MELSSKRLRALVDLHGDQLMEVSSKRIRAASEDRLSNLPDCLIHSILSFLESRLVVRSSVLSRRWRHLWRSVPCIDIDFTVFRRRTLCRSQKCYKTTFGQNKVCKKICGINKVCKEEWQPFEEFSNKLSLLHSAPSLDKLRIHVSDIDHNDKQAIGPCLRWISRGVQRSPTIIDIHVDFDWTRRNWRPNKPFPDLGSSSSRLTKLFLYGVALGDNFAEHLRSGYLVLEDLRLVRCFCHFADIVSKNLRHLTFDDCLGNLQFQGIVVVAPRLTSLHTYLSSIYWPNGIDVMDTNSFIKTSICVITWHPTNPSFLEKLYKIFNIRHLEFFGSKMMESLQRISDKLPKFHNVRTLLIDQCDLKTIVNIQTLDRFLQSVPSLEKLTLQNCEFIDRSKKRTARARRRNVALEIQNRISFNCDNLEVIEIKHSKDDNISEFFELLMGHWRNLGKTNIKLTKV